MRFPFLPHRTLRPFVAVAGSVATFSPASLFASGEQGALYDPSDLTTLFQDSAGTTPVTADGQPVGKILDKSGRGNHATQATAASRPLYKTAGGLHWLQFDGVDDSLVTSAINFTTTYACDIVGGFKTSAYTLNSVIYSLSATPVSTQGSFATRLSAAASTQSLLHGAALINLIKTVPAIGTAYIQSQLCNIAAGSGAELGVRVGGGATTFATGDAGSRTFSSGSLYLGNSEGNPYSGNIYSLVVLGRTATTQEVADTEAWVAAKTGVTLL